MEKILVKIFLLLSVLMLLGGLGEGQVKKISLSLGLTSEILLLIEVVLVRLSTVSSGLPGGFSSQPCRAICFR